MSLSLIDFSKANLNSSPNAELLTKWDAYVESHEQGSIYHLSAWQKLIQQQFGHKSFYL